MFNEQSQGLDNTAGRSTEEKVIPVANEEVLNDGMMAKMAEGERKVRIGIDGNPTMPLTDEEFRQYNTEFNS